MNVGQYDEVDYDEPTVESPMPILSEPTTGDVGFVLGCATPSCACHAAMTAGDRMLQAAAFIVRIADLVESRARDESQVYAQ